MGMLLKKAISGYMSRATTFVARFTLYCHSINAGGLSRSIWSMGAGFRTGVEEEVGRGAKRRMRATAMVLATKSRASAYKISSNVSKVMHSDSLRATRVYNSRSSGLLSTDD